MVRASESAHAGFLSGGHGTSFFLQGAGETGKLPRPSKQGLVGESPSGERAGRAHQEGVRGGGGRQSLVGRYPQEGVRGGRAWR